MNSRDVEAWRSRREFENPGDDDKALFGNAVCAMVSHGAPSNQNIHEYLSGADRG